MSIFVRTGRGEQGFSLVELLVVIGITAVLATAIMNVVLSTMRASTFTDDMRTVMDDGRISVERIRQELRAARRVLETGSSDSSVRFWLDRNQDGQMQVDERICYAVAEIGETGTFELFRWDGAVIDPDVVDHDPCSVADPGPPSHARSIARTLVTDEGVFSFVPSLSETSPHDRIRLVTIEFLLDVRTNQGPDAIRVETTVRLRNVR